MASKPTLKELAAENHDLRVRLDRAEEFLREILSGEADALFVAGKDGAQLFALKDANQSYRTLIEDMSEGALTLTPAGLVLYANRRFAAMLGAPLEKVIGSRIHAWFPPERRAALEALLHADAADKRGEELALAAADGTQVPVNISVSRLTLNEISDSFCMIATDLTEQKRNEAMAASERVARELLAAANQSRGELLRVIEDKTRAEAAQRASEAQYRDLVTQISDGIFITDDGGTLTYCNQSLARIHGFDQPELMVGRQILEFVAPASLNEVADQFRQAAEGKLTTAQFTVDIVRPDGTQGVVEISANARREGGKFVGTFGIERDITERKRAAEALRMAEQQQRRLAENLESERSRLETAQRIAKIGSWETTLATMSVRWSDELHRILETDPATFHPTHQTFLDFVHPEDRARVDENFASSLAGGAPSAIEHRFLMPDKRIKYVEERWQVILDAQGIPIRAVGTCQDISERKRMEAALKESEAEFRILAEAMPQIVWVARADGWNTYISQQWTDYTGLTIEASLGHGWASPFHPDDRQRAADAWQKAREVIGTYSIECRLRRADGVYRWWLVRAVPLKGTTGNILKWFGTCTDIHDLKTAELALKKTKEQLSEAVAIAKLGSWEYEFATDEFIFNDQYYLLHGITADDAGGYRISAADFAARYVYPADAQMVGRNLQLAHESRDPDYFAKVETRILTGAGEIVWVEVSFRVQQDEQGNTIRLVGVNQDITERKLREQEVLAARNQLQATLDAIPDLLFEMGLDGRYYSYHSPRTDLLAAPPEDLLGRTIAEVLPADAAEVVMASLREADATGRSSGKQIELALPQGQVQFELSVSRMAVVAGQAARFICLSRDITERKRVERELHESERVSTAFKVETAAVRDIAARLQAILDTVVDGVITIDEYGTVETINPAAERMFGYAADAVIGRNIKMLMPEPYHGQHDSYLLHYRNAEDAHVIGFAREVRGQRQDGSTFPVDLAVSEMVLGDERHFTGVLRDITAPKAAEQAVIAARIEAERANAAKNSFLATMSHEIRTPMNGVIGMIDVLQQSSLSGPQMEMSNIIRDSAYALLAVINDILDFSKIEAGKLEIDCVPMGVAEVVEKTCEIMDRMAHKNRVELTLFTDPAIPVEVLGDPGRLRQVLINLVNNAIKFSSGKERSGRVSIRALLADTTAGHVILDFKVADNGIGIDEATRARLFAPFVQADVSTTRNYGGTGLGLAISRQLVGMMDGEITVQSQPGKGALFSVRIPFALPTEQRAPGQNSSPSGRVGSDPELVAGLPCLVVVCPDGIAGDLATYLEYGNAVVERTVDLSAARQWIASRSSGGAIVVIDSDDTRPLLDELVVTAREHTKAHPKSDIHFVVIGHGSRRKPRAEGDNRVSVDANALTRRSLLNAVAIASGRVQAQELEALSGDINAPLRTLSSETVRRRGSRILVAEDNEINQSVILHQLALLGYVADLAENGREALARWHQGNHALLLTDLHMPEMDGYELTAAIRRAERGERMPIIALTANALKSEEVRCKEAGMDAYLSKPALLDQLQAMLERWLPIPGGDSAAGDPPLQAASEGFAVLDRTVLPKQIGNAPALIARFFKDYQRSAQMAADEIRTAVAAGKWKVAGDGAHKLKSSSRAVGALALGDVCARLELASKGVDAGAVLALVPEFENAMAAVEATLGHEGD